MINEEYKAQFENEQRRVEDKVYAVLTTMVRRGQLDPHDTEAVSTALRKARQLVQETIK